MTTESRAPDTAAETPIRAQMIIGGEAVDAADGQTFELVNPATAGSSAAPRGARRTSIGLSKRQRRRSRTARAGRTGPRASAGATLAKYAAL